MTPAERKWLEAIEAATFVLLREAEASAGLYADVYAHFRRDLEKAKFDLLSDDATRGNLDAKG